MGDHQQRGAFRCAADTVEHVGFRHGIELRGGFVQDDDRRATQQGASECHALALATGQAFSHFTHAGVQAVGFGLQPLGQADLFAHAQEFVIARVRACHEEVGAHGVVEEVGALRGVGHEFTQLFLGDVADIHSAQGNTSSVHIPHTIHECGDRGLATSGGTDDGRDFSGGRGEAQVVEHGGTACVATC